MDNTPNYFLIAAATLSALAALLHLGCIAFGTTWYRFFGAGERMAQMASAGSWYPAIITTWARYALSGAGVIPRLPLTRVALCIITGIYLLRGLAGLPMAAFTPERSAAFWWWSSAICLGIGFVHLVGLRQAWARL
jgi:hypothetical protein